MSITTRAKLFVPPAAALTLLGVLVWPEDSSAFQVLGGGPDALALLDDGVRSAMLQLKEAGYHWWRLTDEELTASRYGFLDFDVAETTVESHLELARTIARRLSERAAALADAS